MNHFLLPEGDSGDRAAMRYGVNAMELLINGVLKKGGSRQRFEAKLFGGANVIAALSDVGSRNVSFAERFLADEGIKSVGGNVGGVSPRRIQFWPVSGRARQLAIATDRRRLVEQELNEARRSGGDTSGSSSDIELF
jgi:chemotaxis protein CheD